MMKFKACLMYQLVRGELPEREDEECKLSSQSFRRGQSLSNSAKQHERLTDVQNKSELRQIMTRNLVINALPKVVNARTFTTAGASIRQERIPIN